jgi:hypothetical protein
VTFESSATIRARLGPLLALAGLVFLGWLLVGAVLFRSGFYYHYVASPDSTAGEAERALRFIDQRYVPGARNVLVLGDSRTEEGFSSRLANQAAPGINFIEAGMAGTTPRVWYYLLRKVDPAGERFDAVVLLRIVDANDPDRERLADRSLDLAYLPPLVTPADALDIPRSFAQASTRAQAWRTVLLPMRAARADLDGLADSPHKRLREVRANLRAYVESRYAYTGHAESLAAVTLDPVTLHPDPARDVPSNLVSYLEQLRDTRTSPRSPDPRNLAYYRDWLGRIDALYRPMRRPVLLVALPRGPFHLEHGPPPQPALAAVGLTPGDGVTLLAPTAVAALERPMFFFDGLHMNRAGRDRYSVLVAHAVAATLAQQPQGAAR